MVLCNRLCLLDVLFQHRDVLYHGRRLLGPSAARAARPSIALPALPCATIISRHLAILHHRILAHKRVSHVHIVEVCPWLANRCWFWRLLLTLRLGRVPLVFIPLLIRCIA